MLIRRKLASAALSAVAITALSASVAFAGEITGNGKPVPAVTVSSSECSFSGHNDNPGAPLSGTPDPGGQSQSYGQLVRLGILLDFFGATPKDFNPGDSCRGNLSR